MAKLDEYFARCTQPNSLGFKFFITYFLFDPGTGPKAAFWISHEDEQRAMREAGLIPGQAPR